MFILDERSFQEELIDDLIYTAVFSPDSVIQKRRHFDSPGSGPFGIIQHPSILYEAMGKARSVDYCSSDQYPWPYLRCGTGGISGGKEGGCRSGYL